MNQEIIPIDFQYLDVEFLPYYLTAERIQLEWKPEIDLEWTIDPETTKFYVGVRFGEGRYNDHENPPVDFHSVTFTRIRNKNSVRGCYMEAEGIKSIFPLGMRNPRIPPKWPLEEVIKLQLLRIHYLKKYGMDTWVNHEDFISALMKFNREHPCDYMAEYLCNWL